MPNFTIIYSSTLLLIRVIVKQDNFQKHELVEFVFTERQDIHTHRKAHTYIYIYIYIPPFALNIDIFVI